MENKITNKIMQENKEIKNKTYPLIISASRSTDIPAFYSDWFLKRLQQKYSIWTNPFNQEKTYVSYENVKSIVFWSKNPTPLLEKPELLNYLDEHNIGYYIQYTINDYVNENFEPQVPSLEKRLDTFIKLTEKLGKGRVIWRFDPLILTDKITIDALIAKIENIGNKIHASTKKLVFSFVDILNYKKVKNNLEKKGIKYRDWKQSDMEEFCNKLVNLNKDHGWNLQLASCGEAEQFDGIIHNHCIDAKLILKNCAESPELLDYLGVKIISDELIQKSYPEQASLFSDNKDTKIHQDDEIMKLKDGRQAIIKSDSGQRKVCKCVKSKDIGEYNTCAHKCVYCYANYNPEKAYNNWLNIMKNKDCDPLKGI